MVKIRRNPFAELPEGTHVQVKLRGVWVITELRRTKGMKVIVWDPMYLTQDKFIEVDADDTREINYIAGTLRRRRQVRIRG